MLYQLYFIFKNPDTIHWGSQCIVEFSTLMNFLSLDVKKKKKKKPNNFTKYHNTCDNKIFRVNKSKATMLRLKLRYISNYYLSSTSLFLKHTLALTHIPNTKCTKSTEFTKFTYLPKKSILKSDSNTC